MANELTVLESQLVPMAPHFEQALAGVMPVDRLIRTALISVEKTPKLLECNRQSLFNTIMSAGVLGLEMDGITGQAFAIPFAGRAQLVIGYKGYNTLGARAGLTITGEVVREGDDFDYMLGTGSFVKHKPKLGNSGKIIGAWAQAAANDRPPVIAVLGIDELMAIKAKSPGAKKSDSPWNSTDIGFPAMCAKSVKRRLCRSTPLNVMQLAARMEEAFEEQGLPSHLTPDRNIIIDGQIVQPGTGANETPDMATLTARPMDEARDPISRIKADGMKAAGKGVAELQRWWGDLHPADQKALKGYLDETLKPEAAKVNASEAAQ